MTAKTTGNALLIGTAGWAIPGHYKSSFPQEGSHLMRYADRFTAVEINSSFYRDHQFKTWVRWQNSVPDNFLFSVKVPRSITHECRLKNCEELLEKFTSQVSGLGEKLACGLVQLPPSLAFESNVAAEFVHLFQSMLSAELVFEPRHESWFTEDAANLFSELGICVAAVDPSPVQNPPLIGKATSQLAYFRMHGSPRIYYSEYSYEYLSELHARLKDNSHSEQVWCIFDNTALGHATGNALRLLELVNTN